MHEGGGGGRPGRGVVSPKECRCSWGPQTVESKLCCRPCQTEARLVVTLAALEHLSVTFPQPASGSSSTVAAGRPNRRQSEGMYCGMSAMSPQSTTAPVASCAVYGRMTSDTQPTNHGASRDRWTRRSCSRCLLLPAARRLVLTCPSPCLALTIDK